MSKITLKWSPTANTLYDLYRSDKPITLNNKKAPYMTELIDTFVDNNIEEYTVYYYALGYIDTLGNYVLQKSVQLYANNKDVFYAFASFDIIEQVGVKNTFINNINDKPFINTNVISVKCNTDRSPGFMYLSGYTTSGGTYNGSLSSTITTLGTSDFTFELWYGPVSDKCYAWNRIAVLGDSSTGINMVRKGTDVPYKISIQFPNTNSMESTTTLKDMEYNHICLIRKDGVFYLFINGIFQVANNAFLTYNVVGNIIRLGTNTSGTEYTTGIYDSVRLTRGVRYDLSGFTPDSYFDQQTDLLSNITDISIKFNKNGAFDDSTNNRTFTVINNTLAQFFDNDTYMYFNGLNSRLTTILDEPFNATDLTIAYKYRADSVHCQSNSRHITIGDLGWRGAFVLYYNGNTQTALAHYQGGYVYPNVKPTDLTKETDVVLTRNNGIFSLYIDNVLVSQSDTSMAGYPIEGSMLNLGGYNTGDNYCGFIRDVKIYKASLYNSATTDIQPFIAILKYELINKSAIFNAFNIVNNISWEFDNTLNIDNYILYRSNSPINVKNKGTIIAELTSTSYIDTNIDVNKIYYYAVGINHIKVKEVAYAFIGQVDTYKNDLYYDNTRLLINADGQPGTSSLMDSSKYRNIINNSGGTSFLVGPLYKNNDGFARIVGSNTTNNNTANGRIKALLATSLGIDNFTINITIMPLTDMYAANARIFQIGENGAGIWLHRTASTNNISLSYYNGSSTITKSSTNTFVHKVYVQLTVMRKNGIFYLFIDGLLQFSIDTDITWPINDTNIYFGANATNTDYFYGYIDSIVLTRNPMYDILGFTKSTQQFDNTHAMFDNAELLLDFYDSQQSKNIVDKSNYKTPIEIVGDIYAYKRSRDRGWFLAPGDHGLYVNSITYNNGINFTYEMNIISLDLSGVKMLFTSGSNGSWGSWRVYITGNLLIFSMINHAGNFYDIGVKRLSYGNEYHICLQRYNRAFYLYVDGECTIFNAIQPDIAQNFSDSLYLYRHTSGEFARCLVNSIRLTTNVCRYNIYGFTPPQQKLVAKPVLSTYYLYATYNSENNTVKLDFLHDGYIKSLELYKSFGNTSTMIKLDNTDISYIDTDIVLDNEYTYFYRIQNDTNKYKSNEVMLVANANWTMPTSNEFKLKYTETFDNSLTLKYSTRSGSPTTTWDSSNHHLVITNGTTQGFVAWDTYGNFEGDFIFEADILFYADSAVRKHFGFYLDSGSSGINGVRVYNLDSACGMSQWNDTTESAWFTFGSTILTVGNTYKFKIVRENFEWFMYIDDVKLPYENRYNRYDGLRPGFFVYGCTIYVKELRIYTK